MFSILLVNDIRGVPNGLTHLWWIRSRVELAANPRDRRPLPDRHLFDLRDSHLRRRIRRFGCLPPAAPFCLAEQDPLHRAHGLVVCRNTVQARISGGERWRRPQLPSVCNCLGYGDRPRCHPRSPPAGSNAQQPVRPLRASPISRTRTAHEGVIASRWNCSNDGVSAQLRSCSSQGSGMWERRGSSPDARTISIT